MAPTAQIAAKVFNTPLMIDPEKAAVIIQALGPRFLGMGDVALDLHGVQPPADRWEARPEAASIIGGSLYRGVKKHAAYLNVQGVAVIPVTGTLVRRGSFVGESSGMTSYEGLSAQIRAAAEDETVRAIAMEVDSFGGEAAGIFELMADIRAAREKKPVYAFLAEYALSAGYALASQADRVTIPPFGKAGSIGVVVIHADYQTQLENAGVNVTLIHSGKHKVDGNPYQHLKGEVRDRIQQENDAMWLAFAEAVEQGRRGKITAQGAMKLEAGVFTGLDALRYGLADEVIEARAAFEALVEKLNPPARSGAVSAGPAAAAAMAAGRVATGVSLVASSITDVAALTTWIEEHIDDLGGPVTLQGETIQLQDLETVLAEDCSPGCETGAEAPSSKETDMTKDVTKPDAEEQKAKTATAPVPSAEEAVQAERERASKITAKVAQAGLPSSFGQKLISDGVSLEAAYDKILDEKAAKAQDGGDINGGTPTAKVTGDVVDRTTEGITKALYARVGLDGGERNEFTGMQLREMARASLTARGISVQGGAMALAGAAFSPAGASGGMHSTSDFGNILADVANKSMLKGFEETEETFEQFTSTGTLGDFKPTKRVGLDAFPSLTEVPEGAEFKHGTIGDHGESVVLATYGRLFALTRQTIINDDLDAFSRIPMKMGRAARRTVGDLVFAILTGNPDMSDGTALFHADHANLAGSAGLPGEATINAGITAMATQKDRGGNATALNIPAAFLIAGPNNRSAVLQALNSEYAPDDTDKVGTAKMPRAYNTVRDAAKPIFDARISGDAWFLAADPSRFDTIEVSYLDGIALPFLDQQDGWTVDGTEFKVRLDAAAKALAWEGLYKNAGS